MEQWISDIWDVFKIVAPWLTGGLAGAVLTYFLNQRGTRRKQPRLIVSTTRVDYSIPTRDPALKDLRVSYNGEPLESLLFFAINVENSSSRSAKASSFLILTSPDARIVDRSSSVAPLFREPTWEPQPAQRGAYLWDLGELKPGDSAQLRLLVSPSGDIQPKFRGDDEVAVLFDERESSLATEKEIRILVTWLATWVVAGAVPFVSSLLRGLLLVASMALFVRWYEQWRMMKLSRQRTEPLPGPIIVTGISGRVAIDNNLISGHQSILVQGDNDELARTPRVAIDHDPRSGQTSLLVSGPRDQETEQ
jgi:hypothetical protein